MTKMKPWEQTEAELHPDTILLENGSRVAIPDSEGQYHAFRVTGYNHKSYDHCSNALDGEWVYREV